MEVVEEMKKLRELLDKKGIKWQDHSDDFGESEIKCNWICRTWFKVEGKRVSCINGLGTYGGCTAFDGFEKNRGLIEMMIWGEGDPIGYLTAEECIEILEKTFKKRKNED